jgi:hypothetical protein
MGFEIRYHFNEKLDDGNFNKEEMLEKTCKVGDAYEDTTIEKLASSLMGLLARRDIWVVDWEIFEFKKAKISCKETKGGFIIKNKKFNLDGTITVAAAEEIAAAPYAGPSGGTPPGAAPLPPWAQPHEHLAPEVNIHAHSPTSGNRRVVKEVVLDSDLPMLLEIKQKRLQFSEGKKYPVFSERPGRILGSSVYTMQDDAERTVEVDSKYFLKSTVRLVDGDGEETYAAAVRPQTRAKLLYDDAGYDSMPDLNKLKKGGPKAIAAAQRAATSRSPENIAMQRAKALRQAAMQGGMALGDDAGGQPMEMLDVRARSKSKNSLAGVDEDMMAIVARSERKTAEINEESNPRPKGRAPKGRKVNSPVPINPPDDIDLDYGDVPDVRKLRRG